MTGFADDSRARYLAVLVEPPALGAGRRTVPARRRRRRRRLPDPEAARRRAESRCRLPPEGAAEEEAERQDGRTGRVYGYDDARTRYLPTEGVRPPYHSAAWSFQAGKLLEFSPIVAEGVVYVLDKDATMYAIDADNGKVRWKHQIGRLNASSPAYEHGHLRGDPGAGRGGGDARRGRQHDLEAPAARPHRELAGGLRRQGDRRLRVRDGRTPWTRTAGRSTGSCLPAVRSRAASRSTTGSSTSATTRVRSTRSRPRTARSSGSPGPRARASGAPEASTRRRLSPTAASTSAASTAASTASRRSPASLAWSHSTGDWVYAAPAVADTAGAPPTVYIGSKDHHLLRARRPRRLGPLGARRRRDRARRRQRAGQGRLRRGDRPQRRHPRLRRDRPASRSSSTSSASTTRSFPTAGGCT